MKIMVADDEVPARQRLCRLLAELGYTDIIEASHGQEVLEQWQVSACAVILLDIRMPGLDGLMVARTLLHQPQPPALIFTTAYPDYALEAFQVHAVHYLLKPVKKADLQQALERVQRLQPPPEPSTAVATSAVYSPSAPRSALCVRVRGNLQRIEVADIYYFRADQKYVTVRHKNGDVLIEEALKALEQEFAGLFMRIHRNALVANRYLSGMEKDREDRWFVTFKDIQERLEISRRHLPSIRKQFKLDA